MAWFARPDAFVYRLCPLSGDTTPRLTRHDFIQQTLCANRQTALSIRRIFYESRAKDEFAQPTAIAQA